ncbi:hypothetical protein KEM54_002778 [Ascosphaera aggregata]|nr:hypothetical protein KEM54_002778 [Ascosphaera aggregata]
MDSASQQRFQQPFSQAYQNISDPRLNSHDHISISTITTGGGKLNQRQPPANLASNVTSCSKNQSLPDSSSEQKKHRRTRSGCYTCRARRVKRALRASQNITDDDGQDVGKADVNAHENQSSAKTRRCESPYAIISNTARTERDFKDSNNGLIPYSPSVIGSPGSTNLGQRHWDLTFSRDGTRSLSPQSDMARSSRDGFLESEASVKPPDILYRDSPGIKGADLFSLNNEDRLFLNFFLKEIKPEHYFLRQHAPCFLHHDVLQRAFEYPPLMNAILTFAAYLHSFRQAHGKLYTFLHYYQSSLTGLLASLQRSENHHDAMLLTVLQLATFEEYVGDWVNLMAHHQAACRMLKSLYSPADMAQDSFHRTIFFWVTRFDGASANVARSVPLLDKEWYVPVETFIRSDIQERPNDMVGKLLLCGLLVRKFNRDMAILLNKSLHNMTVAHSADRVGELEELEPAIRASVTELEYILGDITGSQSARTALPRLSKSGATGDCVHDTTNTLAFAEIARYRLDLLGSKLLYQCHVGSMMHQVDPNELSDLALEISQLIEALTCDSDPAENVLLSVQQVLSLSVSFLPVDEPHMAWSRKKMAAVESQGYIFPQALKSRLAAFWADPKVSSWWLPHGEGETQLLRETKEWAEEHSLDVGMSEDVHRLTSM